MTTTKISFAALFTAILVFGGANTVLAAARTASVTGNWSSTTTWGGSYRT